ncbi:MAG: HEPN domain-containing protein [Kiritimatiellae bacterium]|nr:HEPN domain-containing protein [Kiritimatiellia bacterium]
MTDENCKANALDETRAGNDCLAEADYLYAGGFFNAAVSRAYFAALHWARALLVLKALEPKTHRGVIQLLHLHYVEHGTMDPAAAAELGQLETYRELSDYSAGVSLDGSRAAQEIARARAFIDACRPFMPAP